MEIGWQIIGSLNIFFLCLFYTVIRYSLEEIELVTYVACIVKLPFFFRNIRGK